jgi:hypothetical protein
MIQPTDHVESRKRKTRRKMLQTFIEGQQDDCNRLKEMGKRGGGGGGNKGGSIRNGRRCERGTEGQETE